MNLRAIEKAFLSDLQPVRPMARHAYLVAGFAAVVLFTVGVGVDRLGYSGVQLMGLERALAILCALIASVVLVADSLARQMVPASHNPFRPARIPAASVAVLSAVVAGLFSFHTEVGFWRTAGTCAMTGSMISILAGVLIWVILRRGAILYPRSFGATFGALAGLAGTIVLEMQCPNQNAFHILAGHLGVMAFGGAFGLALGSAVYFTEQRRNSVELPVPRS